MNFTDILIIILIMLILLLFIIVLFCIVKTIFIRNQEIKVLNISPENNNESNEYAQKLYDLIRIKTTSFETDEAYHNFREKMKSLFPLVHQYMVKEKIDGNVIFTYKTQSYQSEKVLFITHMDTSMIEENPNITDTEVIGRGAFDAKSLLYIIFQAVENEFKEKQKLNCDLTIAVTVDDETTKEGNDKIVSKFLKQGRFFNLVIEQGIGIIDPTFLGLKSNFALVGIGVTGEVKIRYKTPIGLKGRQKLEQFIDTLRGENTFKSQIDKNAVKVLNAFAKDMPYINRLLFSNVWLFRPFVKRIIDSDQTEVSKLLKTHIIFSSIQENEKYNYVDLVFELATHDNAAEVVSTLSKYVIKYGVEYELLSIKDPSKVTSTSLLGYNVVCNTIKKIYHDLYIAPYIITKISEQRYFTRVSDCVIRFSPLYYPYQAIQDAINGKEHVMKKSIYLGVEFFKEILNSYKVE